MPTRSLSRSTSAGLTVDLEFTLRRQFHKESFRYGHARQHELSTRSAMTLIPCQATSEGDYRGDVGRTRCLRSSCDVLREEPVLPASRRDQPWQYVEHSHLVPSIALMLDISHDRGVTTVKSDGTLTSHSPSWTWGLSCCLILPADEPSRSSPESWYRREDSQLDYSPP